MLMKLAPKKRNPRNFYLSIAATVVLVLLGRYFSITSEREKEAQLSLLSQRLSQLSATLPKRVDGLTTLEHVNLSYPDTISYRYKVNMTTEDLPDEERAKWEASSRRGLERLACKETQLLAAMSKYGIRMQHLYMAKDGELYTIDIDADQLNCPERKK
ncbi:hypothetical protein A7D27_26715 [Pseudomonas sp. 1D4]|uniref:hypothetical protein n=1 Tax=Pseudomonas sp. 1D4 TaxID=1843691 RepID=UPI00084B81FA|nr:hypothetical protein [Pseudomonas sp. 1D4]OEC34776.1 hypothetical protein A7D27_26715 [Pseudomonas sp. 1D4]